MGIIDWDSSLFFFFFCKSVEMEIKKKKSNEIFLWPRYRCLVKIRLKILAIEGKSESVISIYLTKDMKKERFDSRDAITIRLGFISARRVSINPDEERKCLDLLGNYAG